MELIHKSTKLESGDFVKVVVYIYNTNFPLRNFPLSKGRSFINQGNPKKEVAVGKLNKVERQKKFMVLSLDILSSNKTIFRDYCYGRFIIRFKRDVNGDYAYKLTKEEAVAELI